MVLFIALCLSRMCRILEESIFSDPHHRLLVIDCFGILPQFCYLSCIIDGTSHELVRQIACWPKPFPLLVTEMKLVNVKPFMFSTIHSLSIILGTRSTLQFWAKPICRWNFCYNLLLHFNCGVIFVLGLSRLKLTSNVVDLVPY